MALDQRCVHILIVLMNNSMKFKKVSELANDFKVSNRMIRYNLDDIDNFLKDSELPKLIRKPHVGVRFYAGEGNNSKKEVVLRYLSKLDTYKYSLSSKERMYFILNDLIQQNNFITIDKLAKKISVSRSTIIKDLGNVIKWATEHNLKLVSIPRYGIRLIGNEKKVRRGAIELLIEIFDINQSVNSNKMLVQANYNFFNKIFDLDISYIEKCIRKIENNFDLFFSDIAYSNIIMHIIIAIKRIQLGRDIVMPKKELNSLIDTQEFKIALTLADELEEYYCIKIPKDEIGYITIHFLGANKSNLTNNKVIKNLEKYEHIAKQIISNVSYYIGIDLTNDKQLLEGFMEHLQPTMYRIKHHLILKNPILSEIKIKYGYLFDIVKIAVSPLEEYLEKNILNEDEIGYLVLHFGASLERYRIDEIIKPDVLVVCGTGIGTAEILVSRLKRIFNINIVGNVAYHQVENALLNNHVDLIVSTLPIQQNQIKSIVVHPLLINDDIEILKYEIQNICNNISNFNNIIQIVKTCLQRGDENISKKLSNYSNTVENEFTKGVNQILLKDLLTKETIKLNVDVKNWEESVRIGGELLENINAIQASYTNAMINAVKELGPYMVIAPGIAMPHARPESGVKKVGMSFITLKEPVNFGNIENDPVYIVICLCATDQNTHLRALSDLVKLLNNEDNVKNILNARDSDVVLKMMKSLS
ncbi:BglG family transcription antiterminator [Pectinatus frisingensis]|uniref:BglG family transcription antiterminator n=1 Tax=Pectinatus frisingensis TaxID=865 RepID=UPI003D805BC0